MSMSMYFSYLSIERERTQNVYVIVRSTLERRLLSQHGSAT